MVVPVVIIIVAMPVSVTMGMSVAVALSVIVRMPVAVGGVVVGMREPLRLHCVAHGWLSLLQVGFEYVDQLLRGSSLFG